MVVLQNKVVIFLIFFTSLLGSFVINVGASDVSVSAKSAVVMNAFTGEVIFAKNA